MTERGRPLGGGNNRAKWSKTMGIVTLRITQVFILDI
jgi:hypothetical protein